MNTRSLCVWLSLSLVALATCAAGDDKPAVPEVEVVLPVAREVSDYEDFTGRTEASVTVQIKPRITGFIDKVLFKDGAEVKKGDLLFEIDPRPYKANLEKAEAAVTLSQAVLARTEAEHKRARALFDRKAIGKDELDKIEAERDEAKARVDLAKAACKVYELNLAYTRVTAPISGRLGRRRLDPGNLVKADETTLATLVSLKPMCVYFDIDERTALRLRRATNKGLGLQVAMGLADEKGFPRQAEVDRLGNRLDPKTGTLRLRASLPNANGLLMPGLFVRVRLTTGKPHKALLVPERAAVKRPRSDLGEKYGQLLVINEKNTIEERRVDLGLRHGDLVVVKEGLRVGDRVVLKGLSGLKEGMVVKPKKATTGGKK